MKRLFLFLIGIILVNSVFAQQVANEVPENTLIYALPQTSIEIAVEIRKDRYIPGPYARFASMFLSVDEIPDREDIVYSVGNVSIKPVIEADYEALFALQAMGEDADFLNLSSQGLIITVNEPKEMFINLSEGYKNFQHFPDQLPSYPMSVKKSTLFDRIKTDSGFISVPYQESIINKKDIQSKAEEASKFLFSLRRRRFELITGDVEHAFSGNSLKDALQEINRLEREYLSLFIGKHFEESRLYKFYVTPEKSYNKKAYLVFHFSEIDGIVSEATRTSAPFMLNVEPKGKAARIEGIKSRTKTPNIYYRVPETVTVHLMKGSQELCSGVMQIYQMGKEFVIPSSNAKK